ncbi:MAG: hypothetical protein KDC75_09160 [Phaeodactylibacter sp.]|nr:hypothetical protein [Phaeodactylibacter sp.]MCB9304656.1 hypothetical protein [Lewinellaceae bacterium]
MKTITTIMIAVLLASGGSIAQENEKSLFVVLTADEAEVASGEYVYFKVQVNNEMEEPAAGVSITMKANGGEFVSSNKSEVLGKTNEKGAFSAFWQAPPVYGEETFIVKVTGGKEGYKPDGHYSKITVHPEEKEIQASLSYRPNFSECGATEVSIQVMDQYGNQLPGATVLLEAREGTFEKQGLQREIRGVTNEEGEVRLNWYAVHGYDVMKTRITAKVQAAGYNDCEITQEVSAVGDFDTPAGKIDWINEGAKEKAGIYGYVRLPYCHDYEVILCGMSKNCFFKDTTDPDRGECVYIITGVPEGWYELKLRYLYPGKGDDLYGTYRKEVYLRSGKSKRLDLRW